VILAFTAGSYNVAAGASTTLTPVFYGGAGVISGVTGPVASGAPVTVTPAPGGTTYTLTVTNGAGASVTASVAITVDNVGAPSISSFQATPALTLFGEPSLLQWTVGGDPATISSLTVNGAAVTGLPTGSLSVIPALRATYTLAASNSAGTATRSVSTVTKGLDLLAGSLGGNGTLDGQGTLARFSFPMGLAVDDAGNVYVADASNEAIRKVTPGGLVTTFAGATGQIGYQDGTGGAARFFSPTGVVRDAAGNFYVCDRGNHCIRKITAAGVVTTLAGSAGTQGSQDGTGTAALFVAPQSVVLNADGELVVSDYLDHTLRKVTPAGVVTTLAGLSGAQGYEDGTGSAARFTNPRGLVLEPSGNLLVADSGNCTIRRVTPAGAVTTLAGTVRVPGPDDGLGAAAKFAYPDGLVREASGTYLVADTQNYTLRRLTTAGAVTTVAGTPGSWGHTDGPALSAVLNSPSGLAFLPSGTLVFSEANGEDLRTLDASRTVATLAGASPLPGAADGRGALARFTDAQGLVVTPSGAILVTESWPNALRRVTPDGTVTTVALVDAAGDPADVQGMAEVAMDAAGNLYFTGGTHAVQKVSPAGVVSLVAGSLDTTGSDDGVGGAARFNRPSGLTLDPSGNLFVCDKDNGTIRKIAPDGTVTTFAGRPGALNHNDGVGTDAFFFNPTGILSDPSGILYVTSEDQTLRKITPAAVVTTIAGTPWTPGFADGSGAQARFDHPQGMALDAAGQLYLADTYNHAVRKLAPNGAVTTVFGVGGAKGNLPGPFPGHLSLPWGLAFTAQGDLLITTSSAIMQATLPD